MRGWGAAQGIEPEMEWWPREALQGERLPDGFSYRSDTNSWWLDDDELRAIIGALDKTDASPDQS